MAVQWDDADSQPTNGDQRYREEPAPQVTPVADPLAGYTPEERDFLIRNQNADGSYDTHRIQSALYGPKPSEPAAAPSGGGGGYVPGGPPVPSMLPAPAPIAAFGETFTAPTAEQAKASGGFQFRLGEALQAIRRGGTAKGLTGTNQVWSALQDRATGLADAYYQSDFNNALAGFETRRGTHFMNEEGRFNSERANRGDTWGQSTDVFGMGRTNRMDDRAIYVDDRNYNRGVLESDRTFDRTLTNDAWGRGADLFNFNRANRQDDFSEAVTLEELRQRARAGARPS